MSSSSKGKTQGTDLPIALDSGGGPGGTGQTAPSGSDLGYILDFGGPIGNAGSSSRGHGFSNVPQPPSDPFHQTPPPYPSLF